MATPAGPGAIGILRLSGPGAADIAAACFRPLGRKGLLDHPTRTLVYGSLLDCEGQVIDQVLCTYSRGPASYTGEDTAELHCHGSPMVLSLGLEALFAQGARQAGPGEFTQRAFLNGRLDLAQAEGVADLLDARSREGARHAAGQLSGALSRKIAAIYSALVDVMAHFHAVLDYPDEDIDPFTQEQLARDLEAQRQDLEALLSTYQRGRRLSRGVKCAIVGRPNAGKSSMINALAGEERMIVSDVAGTTRDSVDVRFERDGQDYVFVDTAGVRRRTKITDIVEKYSVNAALKSTTKADVTLLTLDATEGVSQQDKRLMDLLDTRKIPFMVLVNKCDLVPAGQLKQLLQNVSEMLAFCKHVPILTVSALKGTGLNKILPMARKIHEECAIRVPTGQLNRAMEEVLTRHQPPVVKRVRAKFFYLTQAESQPPTFVFFVSDADRVPESYARYLERALRRIFGITHAPMRLHLRSSHKKSQ